MDNAYNDLMLRKYLYNHYDEDDILSGFPERPNNKYGFIAIKNPDYQKDKREWWGSMYCDEREYIYRKPTAKERREIVINTIIEANGRAFSIPNLAYLLAISDRTLQTLLKNLQEEKIIEIIPRYGKNGARKSNAYKYIGEPCEFYGTGLNLRKLYNPKIDVGFRHWSWKSQIFKHDRAWHDVYKLCYIKFESRIARGEYLKKNNLPLVVPEEIQYLVLRYSYWKGDSTFAMIETQYSKDGTIKIPLGTEEKTKIIRFFEFNLELVFGGSKDNPEIIINDYDKKEKLVAFTWFTENVIERVIPIGNGEEIQFFILGDFTSK